MQKLWIPLLLVCSSAAFRSDAVQLHYVPEDGASVSVAVERVFDLKLTDTEQSMTLDGEEQPSGEEPTFELAMVERETIGFTDEYSVRDGQLVSLRRTFEEIGNLYTMSITDPEGEDFEEESLGTSLLEGSTVLFVWDEEDEEYVSSFVDESEDLDDVLLQELDVEASFKDFLPTEEVEVGDSWELDVEAFIRMTNLSGELHVIQEGDDQEDDEFGDEFDDNLAGELDATLMELIEVDGEQIAVIDLVFDLSTEVEVVAEVDEDEVTGTETETTRFEFVIMGQLHWNLDENHAQSCLMKGDIEMSVEAISAYVYNGLDLVVREIQVFEGTLAFQIAFD
ncbi:MAG: hypothetical protein ACI8X5_002260 [Planctomycetota bacterium]|jgi:hypothetical protein